MKHKHYDLILAWANGAEIQSRLSDGTWVDEVSPCWLYATEYRIKPKMVKVGRHEWPEPIETYTPGAAVWTFSYECSVMVHHKLNENLAARAVAAGMAHTTMAAAEQHRDALLSISRGDID